MNKVFAANKIEVSQINADFLKIKIYAISTGLNRNDSIFTLESIQDAVPTVYNKPVMCYYNNVIDDAESHNLQVRQDSQTGEYFEDFNGYGSEKPVGLIPMDSDVKIENVNGREWLCFEALIWNNYNYQLVKLLKKQRKKKISVEVQVIDSLWENDVETINKFRLHGVTILGDNIVEGIPGARLDLSEFSQSERFEKFRTALNFAYTSKDKDINLQKKGGEKVPNTDKFISKDEVGKGKALNINDSKESMSKEPWGKVDKAALKKACLSASNYSSVCPKVFLQLLDGWKDGKEGSLKYPVMQLKGTTLVYNRYGLASAMAYAEKQGEKDVLRKVNAIYKKLGLGKEEEDMKNSAKKYGYLSIGQSETHLFLYKDSQVYAAPVDGDDDGDEERFKAQLNPVGIQAKMEEEDEKFEEVKMEVRMEDCHDEKMDALEKAKMDADEKLKKMEDEKVIMEEKLKKMEDDSKLKMEDTVKMKMDDLEAKLQKMEDEKKDMEAKYAKMEADYQKMEDDAKQEKMSALMEEVKTMAEDEKLDSKDFEEVVKMVEEGKFASKIDAAKEIVYRSHVKNNGKNGLKMGIHDRSKAPTKAKSIFEDLKETVKLSQTNK